MLLGKLVNKFKKHTLQEESAPAYAATAVQPFRRSARISALYSDNNSALHDSGTESDDDELERLDSMSNASMGPQTGDIMGSSPPNLTSSPPLISDFETNSWDSTGCESGIVMRDRSEEPSESSRENILLDQAINSNNRVLMSFIDAGINEGVEAAGGRTAADSGTAETGAFRPVNRRRQQENQDTTTIFGTNIAFHGGCTSSPTTQGSIGEKRRYDNITPKLHFGNDDDPQQSPIASRLRSYNSGSATSGSDSSRETLIAARRQPVKLIIHNPSGPRRPSQPLATPCLSAHKTSNLESESPPYHPHKRGRLNPGGRPCLDFEKMRERMMMSSACGIGSQEFVDSAIGDHDIEKRRHDWALNSSTSSGRRCAQRQQVRCQQPDCTFRPVELDGTLTGGVFASNKDDCA